MTFKIDTFILYNCLIVFFTVKPDLTQISAVPWGVDMEFQFGSFSRYILPTKAIHHEVTALTGLSLEMQVDGTQFLAKKGQKVDALSVMQALTEFVDYLEQFDPGVTLVAHNGYKFDARILNHALMTADQDLYLRFLRIAKSYTDSIHVLKAKVPDLGTKYRLTDLKKRYLPGILFEDHNAKDDVLALRAILKAVGVNAEDINHQAMKSYIF